MAENLPPLEAECFFIAPIGAEGSQERNRSDGVFEFIVGRAAQELGLTAIRGDRIASPGQINLQIIEHVLNARAAVADLTGLNANVFYELAIRHTARLPVVLIAENDCELPFDIAQMRTIFFDHTNLKSADMCRHEIVSHLRAALNDGAVDSPIATSVDVKSLQSGTAIERNVAELVTAVDDLTRMQKDTLRLLDRISLQQTSNPDLMRHLDSATRDIIFGLGKESRDSEFVDKFTAMRERLRRRSESEGPDTSRLTVPPNDL
jgi:hypothetical protein